MRTRRREFLMILGASALLSASTAHPHEKPNVSPRLLEHLKRAFFGHMKIRGTVVDDAGHPLSDVRVDVSSGRLGDPFRANSDRDIQKVDGSFNFDYPETDAVTLEFSKVGYHFVDFALVYKDPQPQARIEGGVHYYDLAVVMDRVVTGAPRLAYRTSLEATSTPPLWAWDIRGSIRGSAPRARRVWVGAASEVQGPVLYARQTEDGQLELVSANRESGEGLARVTIEGKAGAMHFDAMRIAPTDGYLDTIRFKTNQAEDTLGGVFFFCKLNGLFGKGWIQTIGPPEHDRVPLRIQVYFQPDGTRYVDWPE